MLDRFFAKHPVFSTTELKRFLHEKGTHGRRAAEASLNYHRKAGRLIMVKRGLYAVVPKGTDINSCALDPFLLAARMAGDAVLTYHTALEFHGRAYSVHDLFTYTTSRTVRPVVFHGWTFRGIKAPVALQRNNKVNFGVITAERSGLDLRVATLERTLVDMLDRPSLAGSWEEIWRSLEMIEFFDLDQVVSYVKLLGNATTAAKVGFFLEQHRELLMVEEKYLKTLKKLRPAQPHYFSRTRERGGQFLKEWNLLVPEEIMNKSWSDVI